NENAKKPWLTEEHRQIIRALGIPNAIAKVQWPNGAGQNYEVHVGSVDRFALPEQVSAFDEMVEHSIVVPIGERVYRLSRNYAGKFRKPFVGLLVEEFWRHPTRTPTLPGV